MNSIHLCQAHVTPPGEGLNQNKVMNYTKTQRNTTKPKEHTNKPINSVENQTNSKDMYIKNL